MNHFGRVLPNRKHIILCKNSNINIEDENVEVIHDVKMLNSYINDENENFVIGGAVVYKLLMPYANKIYVTQINEDFEGDVFFPLIDKNEWKMAEEEQGVRDEKNIYDYKYITYIRKKI